MAKIDTLFMTETTLTPYSLRAAHTYIAHVRHRVASPREFTVHFHYRFQSTSRGLEDFVVIVKNKKLTRQKGFYSEPLSQINDCDEEQCLSFHFPRNEP